MSADILNTRTIALLMGLDRNTGEPERRHPVTGERIAHLAAGWTEADLMPLPAGMEPSMRVMQQARILGEEVALTHEREHNSFGEGNPFCRICRPQGWEGSLQRRLILDARFDPRQTPPPLVQPVIAEERNEYFTYDGLADMPDPEWMIHGVVPQGGIGYITGRDGSFKTFLALDIAVSTIAWPHGPNWHGGRFVEVGGYGRALILEGEGVGSMRKRIDAAVGAKDITLTEKQKASIVVRNGTVNLHGGKSEFHGLLDFVREFQPDVVIVDTLNRSAGAADQNSASDMSVITQRLHLIAQAAEERAEHGERCTVIVVAHTDKGDNDARGSSAIEDDADFVLHCKKSDDRLRVRVAKMKDGESGFDITLQAKPYGESIALVESGPGRDGDADTSVRRWVELRMKLRDEIDVHPGSTTRALYQAIRGRVEDKAAALRWMVEHEHVRVESGPRNASLHYAGPVRFVVEPPTTPGGSA
ncbi:hypothetical protein GCM10022399_20030 [Terrabacter ginsenosidimutans]|uniref:AAA family ATPase n=1 Tax=Terrabacter ginsenosidimutans TaxID=490575 RepID=A0ABP7DBS7_9MICO